MDGGDLETRELRYFVAVAEELHFGRAAERLGIAQPPLSRAIRQLERRLGVTLVERTSRSARLTPAGQALLRDGRAALDAVAAAGRRAQRAGQTGPRLVLVLKPGGDGGLLPDILARYDADPAAIPVEIVFGAAERAAMLRDGRADVGLLLRPPDDLTGLDAEELRAEPQVVVLAEGHPLARLARHRAARARPGAAHAAHRPGPDGGRNARVGARPAAPRPDLPPGPRRPGHRYLRGLGGREYLPAGRRVCSRQRCRR